MPTKNTWTLIIAGVVMIIVVGGIWKFYQERATRYDSFAECLSTHEVTMAGSDRCPVCQEQKRMFGQSFRNVIYKNCDVERAWCDEHEVKNYPTWFFDERRVVGLQTMQDLSIQSKCSLE